MIRVLSSFKQVVKMVVRHQISGYEEFLKFIAKLETEVQNDKIYVVFSGTKLPSGINWCPDCETSLPVIEDAFIKFGTQDIHYVYVEVGDQSYWKNLKCPFRTDRQLKLNVIPTIIRWKTPKRLEGADQCAKIDLLELIFSEED